MEKKPIVSVTYKNERISIKNSLPYIKCVFRLSCVVHGPIYGRFMGCSVKPRVWEPEFFDLALTGSYINVASHAGVLGQLVFRPSPQGWKTSFPKTPTWEAKYKWYSKQIYTINVLKIGSYISYEFHLSIL